MYTQKMTMEERLLEAARILYRQYSTLARILFKKDMGNLSKLGLDKEQASKLADWVTQANQFYNNAMKTKEIRTKMGITVPSE